MTEKKEPKRRIQIKDLPIRDLPQEEKELTKDEQKKVQGGATPATTSATPARRYPFDWESN